MAQHILLRAGALCVSLRCLDRANLLSTSLMEVRSVADGFCPDDVAKVLARFWSVNGLTMELLDVRMGRESNCPMTLDQGPAFRSKGSLRPMGPIGPAAQ